MKILDDGKILDTWLTIFLSELIGTTFLMYFGCLGLFTTAGEWIALPPMQGGMVWGFVVGSVVFAIGHLSKAHLNPCVTLCAYLLGHITPLTAIVYVISELFGALIGMCLLRISVPAKLYDVYSKNAGPCGFCSTAVHSDLTLVQAFVLEFFATSLLILFVCSAWDPRNEKIHDANPIKFALLIAVLSIALGPFTGASMNPVRSLAPAVVNNGWQNHWLYWIAPLSASVATTLFYKYAILKRIRSDSSRYSTDSEQNSVMLKADHSASINPIEPIIQESNGMIGE